VKQECGRDATRDPTGTGLAHMTSRRRGKELDGDNTTEPGDACQS